MVECASIQNKVLRLMSSRVQVMARWKKSLTKDKIVGSPETRRLFRPYLPYWVVQSSVRVWCRQKMNNRPTPLLHPRRVTPPFGVKQTDSLRTELALNSFLIEKIAQT